MSGTRDDELEGAGGDEIPTGLRDPLAHLETVTKSIRSLTTPMGKLNTQAFPPLTYVDPPVTTDAPSRSRGIGAREPAQVQVRQPFEALVERICLFEEGLEDSDEVGLRLAHFCTPMLLHVGRLSDAGGQLVSIEGRLDGSDEECELVAHIGQINVLLVRCKVPQTRAPLRVGNQVIGR